MNFTCLIIFLFELYFSFIHYIFIYGNNYWVWNLKCLEGPSWSWSYGSWIYNCLCNQAPITTKVL